MTAVQTLTDTQIQLCATVKHGLVRAGGGGRVRPEPSQLRRGPLRGAGAAAGPGGAGGAGQPYAAAGEPRARAHGDHAACPAPVSSIAEFAVHTNICLPLMTLLLLLMLLLHVSHLISARRLRGVLASIHPCQVQLRCQTLG